MWKLETKQESYTRGVYPICTEDSNSKLNKVQWSELHSGIGLPHLNEWETWVSRENLDDVSAWENKVDVTFADEIWACKHLAALA